jgi:hypothetical protein
MTDFDAMDERAAIMEYDGGMTRFEAETAAAAEHGLTRWQMMKGLADANSKRNTAQTPDHG